MAHWVWKSVRGKRYVFVYIRERGKAKQLPRRLYSHLDTEPEAEIDAAVGRLAAQYEDAAVTPEHILFSDDEINKRVDEWIEYLRVVRKRRRNTRSQAKSMLHRFVLVYFLRLGLKDPNQWHMHSAKLYDHLASLELAQSYIAKINSTFGLFYRWLQEEQLVTWPGQLVLRNTPQDDLRTPLAYTVTPDVLLAFVRTQSEWDIRFLALAGYFFSLRPQETFALMPDDFQTAVGPLACTQANKEARLFTGLAVNVVKQRTYFGETVTPKAHSRGWVACFNKKAAELLVALVNERPDGRIIELSNNRMYRKWRQATEDSPLADLGLKDLRRASIYWLGHHSKLTPIQLMKHARHKDFETTQLYLRRPEEEMPKGRSRLRLGA